MFLKITLYNSEYDMCHRSKFDLKHFRPSASGHIGNIFIFWCTKYIKYILLTYLSRAGSSAIDFTQLGQRKCFGTK